MTSRRIRVLVAALWYRAQSFQRSVPKQVTWFNRGDLLSISVWNETDLQGPAVLVRPDETFSFPLVGQVDARQETH